MSAENQKKTKAVAIVRGVAFYLCFAVGVIGLLWALESLIDNVKRSNAEGILLFAAAFAFGIVLYDSRR